MIRTIQKSSMHFTKLVNLVGHRQHTAQATVYPIPSQSNSAPQSPIPKRALATIQTIKTIEKIPKADKIVKVTFASVAWECVMKSTEPEINSKVVYFEIDSIVPSDDPAFEDMEKVHWRVKTIKLRGQISQGLARPVDAFGDRLDGILMDDGTDVTDLLKVVKYIHPDERSVYRDTGTSNPSGTFPAYIARTDEPRAQNIRDLEKYLETLDFHVAVKMDGTSATYYKKDGVFGACSRNVDIVEAEANPEQKKYWETAQEYGIEERLLALGLDNIALQGEICGPGINGNRGKIPQNTLYIFTAQDLNRQKRYSSAALSDLVSKLNQVTIAAKPLTLVPSLGILKAGTLKSCKELAVYSEGTCIVSKEQREGIVLRSENGRISMKMISPKYLLKHDL
ncbi:hypothetical protein BDR26DRAFT_866373 [Obelidium mucronatum]|nr:hypothetical protein BDR26DRAFT_866373 [Obelidium mucronatum]